MDSTGTIKNHLRLFGIPWIPCGAENDPPKPDDDPTDPPKPKDDTPDPADPPKPPEGDTVARAEYDALMRRQQAADRTATDLRKKVEEYERAQSTELENAQRDATQAQAANDALNSALEASRIENAFLVSNSFDWHNPATAMKLLDREGVTIGDDGKVVGMAEAIAQLAKDNPYLVKDAKKDDDDDTPPPSGDPKDGKGGGSTPDKNRAALEKKYPAIRH